MRFRRSFGLRNSSRTSATARCSSAETPAPSPRGAAQGPPPAGGLPSPLGLRPRDVARGGWRARRLAAARRRSGIRAAALPTPGASNAPTPLGAPVTAWLPSPEAGTSAQPCCGGCEKLCLAGCANTEKWPEHNAWGTRNETCAQHTRSTHAYRAYPSSRQQGWLAARAGPRPGGRRCQLRQCLVPPGQSPGGASGTSCARLR